MGPQSHAQNMNFNQVWMQMKDSTDLRQLAAELRTVEGSADPRCYGAQPRH